MTRFVRGLPILWTALLLCACNFHLKTSSPPTTPGASSPTETIATTAAETSAPVSTATETSTLSATVEFLGSPPGEPPSSIASWLTDEQSPENAKDAYAVGGDDFSRNLFERPFDKDRFYRPDLDIHSADMMVDSLWFYVNMRMDGTHAGTGSFDACYGIEVDVDLDGRGDFVIWAAPPFIPTWTRENMVVYGSSADTVGGPHPLLSDAPWTGATYDTFVFTAKTSGVNAAWVRVSPSDPKSLQIAFSSDVIQRPERFLWNMWADDGIKNPAEFDYNDDFSKGRAGSPYKWDSDFPPKDIWAVDNTCRAPYGFTPNGNEPGGCQWQATPGPQATLGPTYTKTISGPG